MLMHREGSVEVFIVPLGSFWILWDSSIRSLITPILLSVENL